MNKHLQTVLLCMVTIGTVVIGGLLKRQAVMPPTPKTGKLVQYIIAGPNG